MARLPDAHRAAADLGDHGRQAAVHRLEHLADLGQFVAALHLGAVGEVAAAGGRHALAQRAQRAAEAEVERQGQVEHQRDAAGGHRQLDRQQAHTGVAARAQLQLELADHLPVEVHHRLQRARGIVEEGARFAEDGVRAEHGAHLADEGARAVEGCCGARRQPAAAALQRIQLHPGVGQVQLQRIHAPEQLHAFGVADVAAGERRADLAARGGDQLGPGQHALDGDVHQEEGDRFRVQHQAGALGGQQQQLAQRLHRLRVLVEGGRAHLGMAALGERGQRRALVLPGGAHVGARGRLDGGVQRRDRLLQFDAGGLLRCLRRRVAGQHPHRQVALPLHPVDRAADRAHEAGALELPIDEAQVRLGVLRGQRHQQRERHDQEGAHQGHLGRHAQVAHQLHAGAEQGGGKGHGGPRAGATPGGRVGEYGLSTRGAGP
ncbi:hypothetical protein ISF6_3545 [Piscinibacter sakaiensis]|uniref:Uncharacterized protein n=1 Tax=Piscinibacter sakaiensis TaxID=1547922 RepID=A0A0K8P5X4_PISS1|nr:hypothetical protein ISF6_3545 [Piscinibacter sakaiensis]